MLPLPHTGGSSLQGPRRRRTRRRSSAARYFSLGYPQEIQDFIEAAATGREPKSGILVAADTVTVLYAAYLSAEEGGCEVPVPIDPSLVEAPDPSSA